MSEPLHVKKTCMVCKKKFKSFLKRRIGKRMVGYRPIKAVTCSKKCSAKYVQFHPRSKGVKA